MTGYTLRITVKNDDRVVVDLDAEKALTPLAQLLSENGGDVQDACRQFLKQLKRSLAGRD